MRATLSALFVAAYSVAALFPEIFESEKGAIIEGLPSLSPFKTFNETFSTIMNDPRMASGALDLQEASIKRLGLVQAEFYTSASYCPVVRQGQWNCGVACQSANTTILLAQGGDDMGLPYWYIAYNPEDKVLVLSHKGTNKESVSSLLNDANIFFDKATEHGFTNAGKAKIHAGFANAHRKTIDAIYTVLTTESGPNGRAADADTLLITGHSLGAAIALLDAMYLTPRLSNLTISTLLFGMPRVGNKAWAQHVNTELGNRFLRIVSRSDSIAHLPLQEIGYTHPGNELWLTQDGRKLLCRESESEKCSNSLSKSFWRQFFKALRSPYSLKYHNGPYLHGVHMLGDCKAARRIKRAREH